jgi:hypothetical protein
MSVCPCAKAPKTFLTSDKYSCEYSAISGRLYVCISKFHALTNTAFMRASEGGESLVMFLKFCIITHLRKSHDFATTVFMKNNMGTTRNL